MFDADGSASGVSAAAARLTQLGGEPGRTGWKGADKEETGTGIHTHP